MRTQIRFAMHPDDEVMFVKELLADPAVVFIDGPRWKSAKPETSRSIDEIEDYCIVWSPNDRAVLDAEYIETCNDWYCKSEFATIQFLRSTLYNTQVLTQGRIAIATRHAKQVEVDTGFAVPLEARYKALRKFIKQSYMNSVIQWENVNLPRSQKTASRSANPSDKPDATMWVGPAAVAWLRGDLNRCIKQNPEGFVEGKLAEIRED